MKVEKVQEGPGSVLCSNFLQLEDVIAFSCWADFTSSSETEKVFTVRIYLQI